jgi:hypothetical protein
MATEDNNASWIGRVTEDLGGGYFMVQYLNPDDRSDMPYSDVPSATSNDRITSSQADWV